MAANTYYFHGVRCYDNYAGGEECYNEHMCLKTQQRQIENP